MEFMTGSILTQGCTGTPEPAAWRDPLQGTERESTQLSAQSAPGQETRSGQGALARRHTDGPLKAALLKTTFRSEGLGARSLVLLVPLLAPCLNNEPRLFFINVSQY
jgi:hypothetical protein